VRTNISEVSPSFALVGGFQGRGGGSNQSRIPESSVYRHQLFYISKTFEKYAQKFFSIFRKIDENYIEKFLKIYIKIFEKYA
jgi:hypothetical protein